MSNFVFWLMGPTSSGKTTIANYLIKRMRSQDVQIIHYDGDEVRAFFDQNLGFKNADRLRVVKTLVHLANKSIDAGLHVVVSALTANVEARHYVIENIDNLIIGYVQCSIQKCSERDPKKLYERAKKEEINTLIGFNTEYIPPENPDMILDTENNSIETITDYIEEYLTKHNHI